MQDQRQPKARGAVGGAPATNPEHVELASRIQSAVARQPQDQVRCVHLFDHYFRCNWWAPGGADLHRNTADWVVGALSRVRKSSFLAVKMEGGRLVIEEMDGKGSRVVVAVDRSVEMKLEGEGHRPAVSPVVSSAAEQPQTPYLQGDEDEDDGEAML